MSTNVTIIEKGSKCIPAGIFAGTEVFVKDGKIYAMYEGRRVCFEDLPSREKRSFRNQFLKDKVSTNFIRKHFGINGLEECFRQWLFCKFGAMDGYPDYFNDKIIPDSYNSACQKTGCPGRGVICGKESKLKSYEVDTLRFLKMGKNIEEVANELCVTVPAIKSRIRKMKETFNVSNLVALISIATELGV